MRFVGVCYSRVGALFTLYGRSYLGHGELVDSMYDPYDSVSSCTIAPAELCPYSSVSLVLEIS